jgi:hypothetical protein
LNEDELYAYKMNGFGYFIGLASLGIHIFMTIRIWRHKSKETIYESVSVII